MILFPSVPLFLGGTGGIIPPVITKALLSSCLVIPIKPVFAATVTRLPPSLLLALHSPPQGGGVRGGALYLFLKGVFAFLPRVDYYLLEDYPWSFASFHKSQLLKFRTSLVIYLRPFITSRCYERICYVTRPSRNELIYGYRLCPRDCRLHAEGKSNNTTKE